MRYIGNQFPPQALALSKFPRSHIQGIGKFRDLPVIGSVKMNVKIAACHLLRGGIQTDQGT